MTETGTRVGCSVQLWHRPKQQHTHLVTCFHHHTVSCHSKNCKRSCLIVPCCWSTLTRPRMLPWKKIKSNKWINWSTSEIHLQKLFCQYYKNPLEYSFLSHNHLYSLYSLRIAATTEALYPWILELSLCLLRTVFICSFGSTS